MDNKKRNSYVYVTGPDWQGIYRNGELVLQDFRINADDVFVDIVSSGGISEYRKSEYDYRWFDDVGILPKNLSDVKFLAQ